VRRGFPKTSAQYVTYHGVAAGATSLVTATGMGCDNTEIAVVETARMRRPPGFRRIGFPRAFTRDRLATP